MLNAIGTGQLPKPAFHPGCWLSSGTRGTQPQQVESMRVIEGVLNGYLAGQAMKQLSRSGPTPRAFIQRTYEWLGPVAEFSEVQRLLLKRALLPFDFFAKHNEDRQAVYADCFEEGGRGKALDAQIAALAGLPPNLSPTIGASTRKTLPLSPSRRNARSTLSPGTSPMASRSYPTVTTTPFATSNGGFTLLAR